MSIFTHDHPLGAGRSAKLSADSRISIAANSALDLKVNRGFRLDVKPIGAGQLVDYASGALKLTFGEGKFVLSVQTSAGVALVEAVAMPLQWHSVAARVADQELLLYVNGAVHSTMLTGTVGVASGGILIGGTEGTDTIAQVDSLQGVVRGFRVYDYESQPLITFADGSTQVVLEAPTQTLTLQSLGNLGSAVTGSELKSLRVALISGTQRNYASLLTKAGFEDLALTYLYTLSPERPVAAVSNPLSFIIPSAHAWSWDGVWDGVKSTVSVFIPYEDFIIIGEQLVYLYNKDWENFDPTALAFASLGAATIIPIAKPLKPLLGPLKKSLTV
ncbi:hypothetical protein [Marinagarivorans algicola]|uniref:hypothetical protein n=1 Tax=Marinagarivorans algicola TaxID=1513270 RepID=UPI003735F336